MDSFVWFGVMVLSFCRLFLRVGVVLKELLKITVFVAAQAQEMKSQHQKKQIQQNIVITRENTKPQHQL